MNSERYDALMKDESLSLTDVELAQGWHFCREWDGLLIGPGMEEMAGCFQLGHGDAP